MRQFSARAEKRCFDPRSPNARDRGHLQRGWKRSPGPGAPAENMRLRSPVPKCEGPGAPSTWFEKVSESSEPAHPPAHRDKAAMNGAQASIPGTLSVVGKDHRDRGHPPDSLRANYHCLGTGTAAITSASTRSASKPSSSASGLSMTRWRSTGWTARFTSSGTR